MSSPDQLKPWSITRRRALQGAGGLAAVATVGTTRASAVTGSAVLTEGTNLAVAVSPDGRWLAMDLVVSIWVVDARGGTARRLTDDLQDATRPRWSPDGSTIAFQSYKDGNFHLWTIHPDGSGLRQVTRGRDDHREPCFTPDGTALVFSSDRGGNGSYGLYRVELATGTITALTDTATDEAEPYVTADGKVVLTVDAAGIDELDPATGARRTVVPAQTGSSVYGPSTSPTGTLAYVRLTGPACDLVVGDATVTRGEDVFAVTTSWTKEGVLFYTADGTIQRYADGSSKVVPFEAEVGVTSRRPRPRRPDLDSTAVRPALGIASPTASPDGRTIAFRALNALWLADLSTGKTERIVADGYFNSDPDFSPDGSSLLYASDRDGGADLWLHNLASGNDQKLSDLAGAQTAPRFSPDRSKVAYQDQDGIAWVLDLASGQARQVTPTLFQPGRVSWSADGGTLVLAAVKPFSKRFREGTSSCTSTWRRARWSTSRRCRTAPCRPAGTTARCSRRTDGTSRSSSRACCTSSRSTRADGSLQNPGR